MYINQQSTTGYFIISFNSNDVYNDNIIVTNIGSRELGIGWAGAAGMPTLAAGKTIQVGAAGFTGGVLRLGGFTALGTNPQTLTFTGTATFFVSKSAVASTFNGPLTVIAPNITIQGGVFNGVTTFTKTGGVDNHNNGVLNVFNAPLFINQQSNGGYFLLGFNSNDAFNDNITVTSTGTGGIALGWITGVGLPVLAAGKTISVGSAGFSAGNLRLGSFTQLGNAPINLPFTGTAQLFVIQNANLVSCNFGGVFNCTAADLSIQGGVFNGATTFTKIGGVANNNNGVQNIFNSTLVINQQSNTGYFMLGYNSNDLFNDDITITNSGTELIYLGYSSGTGTPTLAAGKTIKVGVGGVTNGGLYLGGFTQLGNVPIVLPFTGTVTRLLLRQSLIGGNLTSTTPSFYLDTTVFNGVVDLTKTGSVGDYSPGGNTFNGITTFTNTGSTFMVLGNSKADTWNADVTFTSAGSERVLPCWNSKGNKFNGNIYVNSIGASIGIHFCNYTIASATLAAGKTIQVGSLGYTSGYLKLQRFTQLGTTPITLNFATTASLVEYGPTSTFGGNLTSTTPGLLFNNSIFNGTVNCIKTGVSYDASNGGNVFNGVTTITNNSTALNAYLLMGNLQPDVFNANTTFNNNGESRFYFAHNHTGLTTMFMANLTLNSNRNTGTDTWSFLVSDGFSSSYSVAGNFSFNNMGTMQSNSRFLNGNGSTATYNGLVTINLSNTHAATVIQMGNNGPSVYNGDIVVTNTGGAAGIYFNDNTLGNSVLNNKTISLGVGGFITGRLSLLRFVQNGAVPQTMLQTTGTAAIYLGPTSRFDGDVNFNFPQVYLNGCTYNGTATIQKNGASDNYGIGGNVFNGATTINNSGNGYLLTGATNADVFNGITTMNNTSTSAIYFAHNHAGQTTTFAQNVVLNSTKIGAVNPFSFAYCEGNNNNVRFDGTLTANIAGTFRSDFRSIGGVNNTAVYNGDIAINLSNSSANTVAQVGINGTSTYNGNISVANTGGAAGITFNANSTASSNLNNKAISLGAGGFTSGILNILRFNQNGAVPQTMLQTTGTAAIYLGPTSKFDGDVNFSFPQVYLNGCTYNGVTTISKNGAVDNYGTGGNLFNGTTTINNSGTGFLLLGATNADVFNGLTTMNNTSTSAIYFAHNHAGQSTTFAQNVILNSTKIGAIHPYSFAYCEGNNTNVRFDGTLTANIAGTFRSDFRGIGGVNTTAVYNGDIAINLSNSSANTVAQVGINGTSTYNGNISVVNTGGAAGITFNVSASAISNLNNKAISLGLGGFTSGTLNIFRFAQNGAVPQTMLQTSGTASIYLGPTSRFDGDVNFSFPQVYLNGCTYNGTTIITKNGAVDNQSIGGNIFNATTTINNSGTGYFLLGTTNADVFNGLTTMNNTSTSAIYFAHNHAGQTTTFAQNVILNSTKIGAIHPYSFAYCEGNNTNVRFDGTLTANIAGAFRSDFRSLGGSTNTAVYNGDIAINLSNSSVNTVAQVGINGTSTYNGNISVANTGGAAGITFNANTTATSNLNNKAISLGAGGFTSGTLNIFRFAQNGAVPQTMLQTTGTAAIYLGPTSRFDGDVNFSFPQVYLNGCTYNGVTIITKNGAVDNFSTGGNLFNSTTTINNSGTGFLLLGNVTRDVFNGITTMNNTSTSAIYFAHNHTGQTTIFAQNVILNSNKTGAVNSIAYAYCEGSTTNVRFDGSLTANIAGAFRSDYRSLGNTGTTAIYNGDVNVNITNTNTNTIIYLGIFGTSTYNGNVILQNTGTINSTQFNNTATATSVMAAGKSVTTGALGFSSGALLIPRFTQLGTALNNLNCTGTTALTFGPTSVFNGGVTSISPTLIYTNSTFNGAVNGTKTGTVVDNSGGNIFNAPMSLTNNGTGYIAMGSTTLDAYNSDATFIQNNTGIVYPNHATNCTYAGNITVGTSAAYAIAFGQTALGIATLTGTAPQTINKIGAAPNPTFTRLVVNKASADVTLNTRINILNYITLTQGIINTTATNILNMNDLSSTTIGNTLSYINGPMNYAMALNGSRSLKFPLGKGTNWRPAILTAKHNAATSYTYTSEVFNANAWDLGYINPPTVSHVSSRRYWDINRSVTSTGVAAPLTNISGNQVVELFYGISDSVTDPANLTICKNTSTALTTWIDIGGSGAVAGAGSVLSTSSPTAFNSYSRFTLGNKWGGTNPLPVQLLSFNAKVVNQKVNIVWATATETNNSGFEIEKSTDGINFELLRFVPAQGNGNATHEQNYTTVDEKPYNGVSYYRLKQVDYNGAYEYSNIDAVEFNQNSYINFYPNPTVNTLLVKASENYANANIKIMNAIGEEVKLSTPLHVYNGSIDVSNLANGFYFVIVQNDAVTESFKINILK